MEPHNEQIVSLLHKYLRGELDPAEYERLQAWADSHPAYREVFDRISTQGHFIADMEEFHNLPVDVERTVAHVVANQEAAVFTFRRWLPYVAAALGIFVIGFSIYGYLNSNQPTEILHARSVDIPPGGNHAVLTLADGRTIDLSEAQTGIVMGNGATYLDGSTVFNEPVNDGVSTEFHSLTTPNGGTYQITLSDSTKIWLNAASTLKYPSRFNGKERVVELAGEAYFAVSKDKKRPFKVISSRQEIEVLGTEFNVSVYEDEPEARTTLVNGSVSVVPTADRLSPQTLRPGEQATLRGTAITVQGVDVASYTAWRDGRFYFRNTAFDEMMRQISRWYDVEVTYRRGVPNETFSGKMSRNLSLMTVLELLNVSDVRIQLEENRLIVD